MKNTKYQEFSAGRAGSGRINLADGMLEFSHEDTTSASNILPISVSHVFTTKEALNENGSATYGKGFKLNLQQKLTHKEGDDTKWKYTDASGTEHKFKERYYKKLANGEKEYLIDSLTNRSIKSDEINIDLDGKLKYNGEEVFAEIKTKSGLELQTGLKNFIHSEFIDGDIKEVSDLKVMINQLKKSINEIDRNIISCKQSLCLLALSKKIFKVQNDIQNNEKETTELNSDLQKNLQESIKTIQYLQRKIYSETTSNVDDKFLHRLLQTNNLVSNILASPDSSIGVLHPDYSPYNTRYATNNEKIKVLEMYNEDLQKSAYYEGDSSKNLMGLEQNQDDIIEKTSVFYKSLSRGEIEEFLSEMLGDVLLGDESQSLINTIIEENINIFIEKPFSYRDNNLLQLDLQIKKLVDDIFIFENNKKENNIQLEKSEFQLEKISLQLPVNFIINSDGIIFGFNNIIEVKDEENQIIDYRGGNLVSIFDSYGNQASIIYEDDKIAKVIDSDEKEIIFEYESNVKGEKGKILSLSDFQDRKTKFEYFPERPDLLKSITYPNDDITTFDYNNDGLLKEITPPSEISVKIAYTNNKVSAVSAYSPTAITPTKGLIQVAYFSDPNTAMVTNVKTGVLEEYTFNANGEKTLERLIANNEVKQTVATTYSNTNDGEVITTQSTDNFGMESSLETTFNELHQPTKTISTAQFEKVVGESAEMLKKVVETTYDYEDNKLIKETATSTVFNSDDESILEKETFQTYEYNKQNKPIRVTNNEDMVRETFYDKKGNVTKSCSYNKANPASKFWQEKEVAENGQVLGEFDERGENKTKYGFVYGTNTVNAVIAPDGSQTSFAIDPYTEELVEMSSVAGGENNSTVYTYEKGMLKSMKSGNTTIEYEYEPWGRKSQVNVNGQKYVSYEYNPVYGTENEKITTTYVQKVDGIIVDGEKYETITDKFGKVLEVSYTNKNGDSGLYLKNIYTTDGKDLLSQTIDYKANKVTNYVYSANGTLLKTENTDISMTAVQDDAGNTTALQYTGEVNQTYGFGFDGQNRLTETILPNDQSATMRYDGLGRITELNNPLVKDEIFYLQRGDHATNLVSTIYQHVGNDTFRRKYTYDSKGNISHIHEDGKLIVRYKYDGLNRLIREDNAQLGKSFTIEYDHKGNILYKGEYPFSLRALNEGNITSFDYIEDKLVTCEYDVLGNPVVYKGKALKWKNLRNLAEYDDVVFDYDASGLRTTKSTANTNTRYYYANNKLLAEKRTVSSGDLELGDYLYEGEIYYTYTDKTDISYMYNANELTGFIFKYGEIEDTYYYRKNLQGDITHIYFIDDGCPVLKTEYVYDAWGNHKVYAIENGISFDITDNLSYNNIGHVNPFRYRGYYYDVETGLYYLQSRYYDPQYGRFINADAIEILDQSKNLINGLNLYAYCNNNPVMNIDPSGQAWWHWVIGIVGTVAIVALAVVTAGAIVAALPAIAGFAGAVAGSLGFASAAGALATAISIGGVILAGATIAVGINEAISFATGFNPMASLIGDTAYGITSTAIGIAGMGTIMFGSMLPYPTTGDGATNNPNGRIIMQSTQKHPNGGDVIMKTNDPRFPSWLGWQKYQVTSNLYTIHYIGNRFFPSWYPLSPWFDFKFVKGK